MMNYLIIKSVKLMDANIDVVTRRQFLRTFLFGAALSWTIPIFLERTFLMLNAQVAVLAVQTITGRDNRSSL